MIICLNVTENCVERVGLIQGPERDRSLEIAGDRFFKLRGYGLYVHSLETKLSVNNIGITCQITVTRLWNSKRSLT